MMMNKSLKKCYLMTRLLSIDNNDSISDVDLFHEAQSDYTNHQDYFLEVFKYIYVYNTETKKYVKKRSFNNDYFDFEFELGRNIIDHLFHLIEMNQMKYKVYFCLKSIACTFLFLFDKNPTQIFEAVSIDIENYYIIFDDKIESFNKEIEERAKTAICAFSFLISSLHSNKVMDAFVSWYFTNMEKFSDIQNYCFNYIFLYVFELYISN